MMHYFVSLLAAGSLCLAASVIPQEYEVVKGRALMRSQPFPSLGDDKNPKFDDLLSIPPNPMLKKIAIQGGDTFGLSIHVVEKEDPKKVKQQGKVEELTHGNATGKADEITPAPGDYIMQIELCADKKNGSTRITSAMMDSLMGDHMEVGEKTKNCHTFKAPNGFAIVGAYGRAGNGISQLGFYYGRVQDKGLVSM